MPDSMVDLEGLAECLLAPRDMTRDQDGALYHPAFPVLDEGVSTVLFLAAFGLECAFVDMESDAPALFDNDGDGEHDMAAWTPTPPASGWVLLEIFDGEDGPCAMFARRESPPEFNHRTHSRRYPEWAKQEVMPGDPSNGIVARAHGAGLDEMRDWILRSLPSALRPVVSGICHPPFPAWVRKWTNMIPVSPDLLAEVEETQHKAIQNSLECAALWLENGGDPRQAAAEIRFAAARVKKAGNHGE